MLRILALLALVSASALTAPAAVTRVELVSREDFRGGRAFGTRGAYEQIRARVFFAADPALAANQIIVDLPLGPRNERGQVEWSADLLIIKPTDTAKGNGTILYEVSNRGGFGLLDAFSLEPEDPFLFEQGFTLVSAGWQWDIPRDRRNGLRLEAPIATDQGRPIRGPVRAQFIPLTPTTTMWLGDRDHIPYPVISGLTVTVQQRPDGERQTIPPAAYRVTQNGEAIEMPGGFQPGRIYEAVYTSENPRIAGLGLAAVRDIVSFLKYGGPGHLLSAENRHLKRAIGFGRSQSGRFLRKFLYDGFNRDEQGRQVFDGVWAHVAGSGRGSFNHRFAQASRDGHPWMNFFYPTDLAPFDNEALLAASRAAKVVPKLFQTNGSYEYWGRAAALTHTDAGGREDLPVGGEQRSYFLAGTQHAPMPFPPETSPNWQYPANSVDYRFVLRALLVAMNQWVTTGKEPPPSAVPTLARSELVRAESFRFPLLDIPAPRRPHRPYRLDFGPEFLSRGIITREPPALDQPYPILVPAVDEDGNETSGVRLPQVAVPLAVYTGWNYRTAAVGAAGEMFDMVGSTFPLPAVRVRQLYQDQQDYLHRTLAHGRALVKQGFLLEEDLMEILSRARSQWEHFVSVHWR